MGGHWDPGGVGVRNSVRRWSVGLSIALAVVAGAGWPLTARADSLLMVLPEVTVTPGATVDVPLMVHGFPSPKRGATDIAGLDFEISWDAAVAELMLVESVSATDEWLVADNPEAGRVRVSMAGLQSIAPPASGIPILRLRFHIVGSAGDTVLDLSRQRAFDLARQAVPSVAVDGRLIVSAVPVPVWSLGRLRAAFVPTAAAAR